MCYVPPHRIPIVLSKPWADPAEAFLQRPPDNTSVWKVALLCRLSPSFFCDSSYVCVLVLYSYFSQLESLTVPVLVFTSDLQFPTKCDCIPSERKQKQSSRMQCCAALTWTSIPTFQRSWIFSNKNMWIPLFNTPSSGEVPQHWWYQVRRSAEMLE